MATTRKPRTAEAAVTPEAEDHADHQPDESKPRPLHGPGSQVNWDNPKNAPSARKNISQDPDGKDNLKLLT